MTWLPPDHVAQVRSRGARESRQRRSDSHPPSHVRKHRRASATATRRTGLLVLALFLFVATWVGARAWLAKEQIAQAQAAVLALKEQVASGQYEGVVDEYDTIRDHTAAARGLIDDPLWRFAERVPVLGDNLGAFREITWIVDDAMVAAAPLADLATALDPSSFAPQDGALPMEPLITASSEVPRAAVTFQDLAARLDDVSTARTVGPIRDAKSTLSEVLDEASVALNDAAPVAEALPSILGADGIRTYVVMFLNNAELRSLGGTALSFAEITVDDGRIALTRQVPAAGENFPKRVEPVIPVPEGFEDIYPGTLGRFVANATIRPSAETAAEIVRAEWEAKFGAHVDGVVSMDVGALSALLKATDPITLSTGDVVAPDNVAALLLNTVYLRYNSGDLKADNVQQGLVYDETLTQTFARISSGQFDPITLVESMSWAAGEGRFSVWLTDEGERAALTPTGMAAGGLPVSTETEDVIGVYLNDQVGAKLNFYLGSQITTGSAQCTPDGRQVHRVALTLSSLLPPETVDGLTGSITGIAYRSLGLEKGEQRFLVFVYLPPGATVLSAVKDDGEVIEPTDQSDEDHPVQSVWMNLEPGETEAVTLDVLMGTPGERELVVDYTPTVRGVGRVTEPLACDTVALP